MKVELGAILKVEIGIVNVITQDQFPEYPSRLSLPVRIDIFGKAQLCLWRIHSGLESSLTQRNSRGGLCVMRSMTQRPMMERRTEFWKISADGCTGQVDRLGLVD